MNSNDCVEGDAILDSRLATEGPSILQRLLPARNKQRLDESIRIQRIERIATWMDSAFRIPGTDVRVGLDSLIGLIPGVGDATTFAVSCFIIREAWILGLPKRRLLRMVWNTSVDTILGSVPLVGDLFDAAFKSNSKNATLILDHFHERDTVDQSST